MNGNKGERDNAGNKPAKTHYPSRNNEKIQYILIIITFILLIATPVFFIININQVITDTAISSYQTNELEIVREASRGIQEYVYVQTEVLGRKDIANIELEVFKKYVAPIHLLKSGNAWMVAPDHVVFDESADLPVEFRGRNIAEIFALQSKNGASHYEDMTFDVTNAREGVGYYVWLPEKGREITAWTPVKVGNYTWTIGLSTPLTEILDANNASSQVAQFRDIILFGIIIALILLTIWIGTDRRRREAEEALQEGERKYRRALFDRSGDSIYLLGLDDANVGKIIDANRAAADMHGYSIEELQTLNVTDLETPESAKEVPERFRRIKKGEWILGETIHRKKDGTVFPVEYSGGLLEFGTDQYVLAIDRDISERKRASDALKQATKKLSLLNYITFNDIQNAIHTIDGYLELGKTSSTEKEREDYRERQGEAVQTITRSLNFAKSYQDLGIKPPAWQDVNQSFLYAISHLDFLSVRHTTSLSGLEIFADPLLETVFLNLSDNVLKHGKTATQVSMSYTETPNGLTLVFEDNGVGIPHELKKAIFIRKLGSQKGNGLYLAREILSITGITITENGTPGEGTRFEIVVPKGEYRFAGTGEK